MAILGKSVTKAAQLLQAPGQLVAIPTETVYGLAGNALNEQSLANIFAVKNRPAFDPLILHLARAADLHHYTSEVPPAAKLLAEAFWPGPLTLVLPKTKLVPELATAGLPTAAFRVPAHPLTQELLQRLAFPLAAPSANPFGYLSPTTAEHVNAQLGDKIPYILDGGPAQIGVESTIVGFSAEGTPVVLRLGGIGVEVLEKTLGQAPEVRKASSSQPAAPGMLTRHYSPHTPIIVGNPCNHLAAYPRHRIGILSYMRKFPAIPPEHNRVLAPTGDPAEAARNLFRYLHELDALGLQLILAEPLPEAGLGRAINDRLRRAAAKG